MQAPKPQRRPRRSALVAALVAAALCFALLKQSGGSSVEDPTVGQPVHAKEQPKEPANDQTRVAARTRAGPAGVHVREIRGLETLWEVPEAPLGLLFVAHGCSHQGSDFFPQSDACPHCLGLPEELAVREAALKRGYAVVAITSFDRSSKCWQNTQLDRSEDLQRVPDILRTVMKEEGLEGLPLFALGASSGGSFVLRVAQIMPEVEGVVCQIAPVKPSIFDMEEQGGRKFPPTLFVHMALRDPEKAETVTEALAVLKEGHSKAAEIKVRPQPVTVQLLRRSPQISAEMAAAIVGALKEGEAIDHKGFLGVDPRSSHSQWRQLLRPVVGELSLDPDVSQVAELLNVAYARHELVSDFMGPSLTWLEAGGKKSIDSLLGKHRTQ